MKTILVVEHAPNRADGVLRHLRECDPELNISLWRCTEASQPPETEFDGLILGGGPMMVEDLNNGAHDFYVAEKSLIQATVAANVPLLGICLGAQMLADLFGGAVEQQEWAIGWNNVKIVSLDTKDVLFSGIDEFATFELHRDHITKIPPRAIQLATSENSMHEAFRLEKNIKAWACIFHPEIDIDQAEQIFDSNPSLFTSNNISRSALATANDGRNARQQLFRNFLSQI